MMYQSHRIDVWEKDNPNTVIWTSYTDETYLTALEEKPPEVKTSYLEVPASDGVIDLTDAVAGRPIYGRREVDFTVQYIADDHDAALEWLQDSRALLHGKRLCVSTPDSRTFNGWFVGRLTVTQAVMREHATLSVHVDCSPWIYYGVEHVALQPGTVTTINDGTEIPQASRDLYLASLVTIIRRYTGSIGESTPHSVSLVQSNSDNLIDVPNQCRIAQYRLSVGDNWDTGWSFNQLHNSSRFQTSTNKDYCYRYMVACSQAGADNSAGENLAGMSFYRRKQYIGVKVSGTVTANYEGQQAHVKAIFHGSTSRQISWGHARQLEPSRGGLSSSGTNTDYVNVTIANDGTFEQFAYISSEYAAYDSPPANPLMWATWGVEVSYATISDLSISYYIGYTEPTEYVNPSNVVSSVQLPVGFYSDGSVSDTVSISKVSPTMLTSYWDDSRGGVPTRRSTPETYQVGSVRPQGTPKWVWSYSPDFFGLYMSTTVTLAQSRTIDVDAGEMPTTMSIETSSPLYVTIDDKSYLITSSGYAPFAFSGEKTLAYTLYGNQAAYIDYEKGII